MMISVEQMQITPEMTQYLRCSWCHDYGPKTEFTQWDLCRRCFAEEEAKVDYHTDWCAEGGSGFYGDDCLW